MNHCDVFVCVRTVRTTRRHTRRCWDWGGSSVGLSPSWRWSRGEKSPRGNCCISPWRWWKGGEEGGRRFLNSTQIQYLNTQHGLVLYSVWSVLSLSIILRSYRWVWVIGRSKHFSIFTPFIYIARNANKCFKMYLNRLLYSSDEQVMHIQILWWFNSLLTVVI